MTKQAQKKSKRSQRDITLFLLRERLKTALPIALAVIALGAIMVWSRMDFSHERALVAGKITGSSWKEGTTQFSRVAVYVHLDDGRDVTASGHWHKPPHAGDRITLSERESPSGQLSYVVPDAAAPAQ